MFNDDYFNDEDYKNIEDLLTEYFKMKRGEAHALITETDLEMLFDYFEMNGDKDNMNYLSEYAIRLYPFSVSLLIRKAEWLINQKKFGQALLILDTIDELEPNNIDALLLKSDIYLDQERTQDAIKLLESKVDIFDNEEKTDILLELSDIYDETEEFELVYSTLKRVLLHDPQNEEAALRICFWAELNGEQEDSIALHQQIIDIAPYNTLAWYNLGVAYQGLKFYEKAIDAYDYCLAIDEKFEYAYRNKGDAYIRLKKFKEAIEVLEMHISIAKPDDVILEAIGYCWDKQKEYAKARNYYRKASALNPQDDQIFYKIGETYTKEMQWEKAIKAYSVALHINKYNPSYCMALGNCLMEMNAQKEALVCYLNAVQLRPDIKSTWQSLVKALYISGYFEEALSQLIIAEDHCGYKIEFKYYKSAILLALGKAKEAVITLEDALTENSKKITALKYIDKDILHHPLFAEVLVRQKRKK